jgi:hypothetical protein
LLCGEEWSSARKELPKTIRYEIGHAPLTTKQNNDNNNNNNNSIAHKFSQV